MRTRIILVLLPGWLVVSLLTACISSASGPQAWLDKPLDHTIAPLAPLHIIAHASDASGVASIELYVNSQLLATVGVGGTRLGWVEYKWTPPAPGDYVIGARGINNNGSTGALTTSLVTISEAVTATPIIEKVAAATPASAFTITVAAKMTNTPITPSAVTPPSVTARMDANCRQGPGTMYEVYGSLLKGQEALIKGRLADNSWLLVALAGRSSNCWIAASTVDVRGDLNTIPVADTPPQPQPADITPPPPQPADTTAPSIYGAATDISSMCASDTVTSNIIAFDEGGISMVYATWSLTNNDGVIVETGYVTYVPLASYDNVYSGVFGTFSHTGTLNINGTVVDSAGNSASFSHVITIDCS